MAMARDKGRFQGNSDKRCVPTVFCQQVDESSAAPSLTIRMRYLYTEYMKYVILGNGVAGTTAALNIRKFDTDGEIIVITEEDIPFYSRIRLPEYLSRSVEEKNLILHN